MLESWSSGLIGNGYVRCSLPLSQLKINISGPYVRLLIYWEAIIQDQLMDKDNTFRF